MRIRQEYQKLSAKRELDVNLGKFSYIEAFFFTSFHAISFIYFWVQDLVPSNYRRVLSRTLCVCETGCWERSQNASSFDFPPNLPFSATLRPGLTQPLEGLRNCSSFSVPADVMSLILMRFFYLPSSLPS